MEVFEQWFYYSDIKKMMKLTGELTDPLDITFGKLWISFWGIVYQDYELAFSTLLEIEEINEELKDEYIGFQLDVQHCWYYSRINGPVLDGEKALEYLKKIEKKYPTPIGVDDFEKFFIEGAYYYTKGLVKRKLENNIIGAIEDIERSIERFRQIPKYGKDIAIFIGSSIAGYYIEIGNFDEARQLLINFINLFGPYNNNMIIFAYNLLVEIEYRKGEINKAIDFNAKIIDLAKKIESNFWITYGLSQKADFLYQEGEYDKALKYYNESLEYRKNYTPLHYFWGKYEIFMYHYKLLELKNESSYWEKSKELYEELEELSEKTDDMNIKHFTSFANALILKKGNLRDKGRAMDILEELSELYSPELEISLHLVELLFDDFSLSGDEDIIRQIDALMFRFTKMPSLSSPNVIAEYTKYQILVGKYNFLVKRDPAKALEILRKAKNNLLKFKLDRLIKLIDVEIEDLEYELTQWDSLDQSVKKKIKTSEMRKYIKMALVSVEN
jgi:tetratricopeptide (TPR) repeat protein